VARRLALPSLVGWALVAACAGGPPPGGDDSVPAIPGDLLAVETVAVLPLLEVVLPVGTPAVLDRDSLADALAAFVDAGLAQALQETGTASRALAPAGYAPALAALGPATLAAAYAAADSAAATGDELSGPAARAFADLAAAVGVRLFLVPRRLVLEPAGVLTWRGDLRVALVDGQSGQLLWLADPRGQNPTPPPGDSPDLLAAALEKTVSATVSAVARGLGSAGKPDTADFEDAGP